MNEQASCQKVLLGAHTPQGMKEEGDPARTRHTPQPSALGFSLGRQPKHPWVEIVELLWQMEMACNCHLCFWEETKAGSWARLILPPLDTSYSTSPVSQESQDKNREKGTHLRQRPRTASLEPLSPALPGKVRPRHLPIYRVLLFFFFKKSH